MHNITMFDKFYIIMLCLLILGCIKCQVNYPLIKLNNFLNYSLRSKNIRVRIKDGEIQGKQKVTVDKGKTYYSFQGVPYATPPVGDLRLAVINPFYFHTLSKLFFLFI